MRILVTGSRDWGDPRTIYIEIQRAVASHPGEHDPINGDPTGGVVVVHGACPTGADDIADDCATTNWWQIERHPADWSRGKKAGPERNKEMVALGADICLAFIKNGSRGATGCADLAEKAGIPTKRFVE